MRNIIFLIVMLGILSCTIKKTGIKKGTCFFDRSTLSVTGSDKVKYECYTPQNINTHVMYWLMDVDFNMGYYTTFKDYVFSLDNIDFKICNCKDTVWAKQQILNEMAIILPYKIIDSFITVKYFDFVIRDSSYCLKRNESIDEPEFGTEDLGNDLALHYNWYYPYFLLYETMLAYKVNYNLGGAIRMDVGNVTPPHMKNTSYNIIFPWKVTDYPIENQDEYFTFMRDSIGVDISVGKEEFLPVKMIIFDK
jgi:hypothetical protein